MASNPPGIGPRIRRRPEPGPRAFNTVEAASDLFPASDALHDRIKLRVRVEIQLPPEMSLGDYAEAIDHRAGTGRDIFRVELKGPDSIRISTQSGNWLFSLHGTLRRTSARTPLRGILDLDLNPTRFATYQTQPFEIDAEFTLARDPAIQAELQAYTLDCSDNFLLGSTILANLTGSNRSNRWQALLQSYIEQTLELCQQSLAPQIAQDIGASLEIRSVAQCECYWELGITGAPLMVNEIARRVRQNDPQAQIRSTISANMNANWLNLELADKIHLCIYAKHTTRLRFEIRYSCSIQQELRRSHRATSSEIDQRLMDIRECAAIRLQNFWTDYQQSIQAPSETMQVVDFLSRFNANTPEAIRADLLTLLAANRAVIASEQSAIATPRTCQALRRAGILTLTRHRNRGQVYRIAEEYREVFAQLFDRDDIVGIRAEHARS